MNIIPVIDIRNGVAVHAIAGERNAYRAIESQLTSSTQPVEVLKTLKANFGCGVFYVADLDAIEGRACNHDSIVQLALTGVSLIVDAGVTSIRAAEDLLAIGVSKVALPSESLRDLRTLKTLLNHLDSDKLVFSIDLKRGELLVNDPLWQGRSPLDLARFVIDQGLRQLIVLDLAAVGTGNGIPTLQLCRDIKHIAPEANIISGGGVDSLACVQSAADAGLDGLLIASALHDGRLTPAVLKSLNHGLSTSH
jgi:phosphoribosylformimino-5-aminoimidazole carboxamide ribotide isomerase